VRGPGQEAKHNSCQAARAANKNKTKTSYSVELSPWRNWF